MAFSYCEPPINGALRQGEILSDVCEHQAAHPPVEVPEGTVVPIQPVSHPRLIVMSQDCDLLRDWETRVEPAEQQVPSNSERDDHRILPHILLCELYERSEIHGRFLGKSTLWNRVSQDQDERYHCLRHAAIGTISDNDLPELYLDFKKILSLPAARLYEAVGRKLIGRVAVVPPIYLHDLIQRFCHFLARVALPE